MQFPGIVICVSIVWVYYAGYSAKLSLTQADLDFGMNKGLNGTELLRTAWQSRITTPQIANLYPFVRRVAARV